MEDPQTQLIYHDENHIEKLKRLFTSPSSRFLGIFALLVLVAAVPLTVKYAQQQQNKTQNASFTTAQPGIDQCETDTDCNAFGTGLVCKLVPVGLKGGEFIKQCVPPNTVTVTQPPTSTPSPSTSPDAVACTACQLRGGTFLCTQISNPSATPICSANDIAATSKGAYSCLSCTTVVSPTLSSSPSPSPSPSVSIPPVCGKCTALGSNFLCTYKSNNAGFAEPQCSPTDISKQGLVSCISCAPPTSIPTVSPSPSSTLSPTTKGVVQLYLSLAFQGIGNVGSNASPTGSGNTTPQKPSRAVTVDIYDANNAIVTQASGQLNLDAVSGFMKGTLSTNVPSGTYSLYVKSDRYLRKRIPGFQSLQSGNNTIPQATLIVGDINGDNKLDILDFNILFDCYGSKSTSANCLSHPEHANADLNDDGVIDGVDYNLFISNLSHAVGD